MPENVVKRIAAVIKIDRAFDNDFFKVITSNNFLFGITKTPVKITDVSGSGY